MVNLQRLLVYVLGLLFVAPQASAKGANVPMQPNTLVSVATALEAEDKANNIVLLGDSAIGKTKLFNVLADLSAGYRPDEDGGSYEQSTFNLAHVEWPAFPNVIKVDIWDTGGSDENDQMIELTLSQPSLEIVVMSFGCDSMTSVGNIESRWLPLLKDAFKGPRWPIIYLVGLKCRLWENGGEENLVKWTNVATAAENLSKRMQWPMMMVDTDASKRTRGVKIPQLAGREHYRPKDLLDQLNDVLYNLNNKDVDHYAQKDAWQSRKVE